MTIERYVNSITRKVKCSKTKREEVKQQLLSEISSAIEKGETPEQIMARMGKAADVADGFNQKLSRSEIKAYKKSKRIKDFSMALVVILILILGVYRAMPKTSEIGTSGVFEEAAVEEAAKQVIESLNEGDFAALQENATDMMKQSLTQEVLDQAKVQIGSSDWGAFQSFGNVYMIEVKQKGQVFAMTETTVVYENVSITYTITLDEDMKLAGLYMK